MKAAPFTFDQELDRQHYLNMAKNVIRYTKEQAQKMLERGEVTHISKCRLAGTMTEPGSDSLCVPNLTGSF